MEEKLKQLESEAQKLLELLQNNETGLLSWHEWLKERLQNIVNLSKELGVVPSKISKQDYYEQVNIAMESMITYDYVGVQTGKKRLKELYDRL